MVDSTRSRQDAALYPGPWSASHRSTVHFDRLRSAKRLGSCDDLAHEVKQKQDTLLQELEKFATTQNQLAGATASDLLYYLHTFPIHLGVLTDSVTTAQRNFEASRSRYNQECLGQPAPEVAPVSEAPDQDAEFSVVELPATIGGEVFFSEPPLGWVIAGYGILGVSVAVVAVAGSELTASNFFGDLTMSKIWYRFLAHPIPSL